ASFLRLERDRLADLVTEAPARRDALPSSQTERLWRWIGFLVIVLLLLEGRLYTARQRAHVVEPALLSRAPAFAVNPARRARGVSKPSKGGRRWWRWGYPFLHPGGCSPPSRSLTPGGCGVVTAGS